jgi:hypothetical protein
MSIFRKVDEMDKYIEFKSMKISYYVTALCLLIWAITDVANNRNSLALMLLLTQLITLSFFKLRYTKKLGESSDK